MKELFILICFAVFCFIVLYSALKLSKRLFVVFLLIIIFNLNEAFGLFLLFVSLLPELRFLVRFVFSFLLFYFRNLHGKFFSKDIISIKLLNRKRKIIVIGSAKKDLLGEILFYRKLTMIVNNRAVFEQQNFPKLEFLINEIRNLLKKSGINIEKFYFLITNEKNLILQTKESFYSKNDLLLCFRKLNLFTKNKKNLNDVKFFKINLEKTELSRNIQNLEANSMKNLHSFFHSSVVQSMMNKNENLRVLCPSCNHKYFILAKKNNPCPNCRTPYFVKAAKQEIPADIMIERVDFISQGISPTVGAVNIENE